MDGDYIRNKMKTKQNKQCMKYEACRRQWECRHTVDRIDSRAKKYWKTRLRCKSSIATDAEDTEYGWTEPAQERVFNI
jgi:hypothetical protein